MAAWDLVRRMVRRSGTDNQGVWGFLLGHDSVLKFTVWMFVPLCECTKSHRVVYFK